MPMVAWQHGSIGSMACLVCAAPDELVEDGRIVLDPGAATGQGSDRAPIYGARIGL